MKHHKNDLTVTTYVGDAATSNRTITGLGFQTRFSWLGNRSATRSMFMYDSLLGKYVQKT